MLHVSLLGPACLVLTHSVLQIENWIAPLAVLLQIVTCRSVDHNVSPCLSRRAVIIETTHLSLGNVLLRTVVVSLWTLWNLDAASLTVVSCEGLGRGIDEARTADVDEVIVETGSQRIGDSHESTFPIGLHLIFLVANVEHDLTSLWGLDVEVGTSLFVNFREIPAWQGGLRDESIIRNLQFLWHLDVGTFGLKAQKTGCSLPIAASQLTVAGGVKVKTVRTVGTAVGRDDLAGMNGIRKFVDLLVASDADTLTISLDDTTHIERYFLRFQFQVTQELIVDVLYLIGPLGIACVRLALMHKDSLDDTILLCFLCQRDESLVGIVAVSFQHAFHPAGRRLDIVG